MQPEYHKGCEIVWVPNRLTNVLESRDNQGIQPNNEGTNTLYEYKWCDNVDEVKHMRHNQPQWN